MKLAESEVTIEDGRTLVLTLSLWQVLVFLFGAAGVVGSVWLATRDLGAEVVRLSKSVDALVIQLGAIDARIDDHERRLWKLEQPQGAVGGR